MHALGLRSSSAPSLRLDELYHPQGGRAEEAYAWRPFCTENFLAPTAPFLLPGTEHYFKTPSPLAFAYLLEAAGQHLARSATCPPSLPHLLEAAGQHWPHVCALGLPAHASVQQRLQLLGQPVGGLGTAVAARKGGRGKELEAWAAPPWLRERGGRKWRPERRRGCEKGWGAELGLLAEPGRRAIRMMEPHHANSLSRPAHYWGLPPAGANTSLHDDA